MINARHIIANNNISANKQKYAVWSLVYQNQKADIACKKPEKPNMQVPILIR